MSGPEKPRENEDQEPGTGYGQQKQKLPEPSENGHNAISNGISCTVFHRKSLLQRLCRVLKPAEEEDQESRSYQNQEEQKQQDSEKDPSHNHTSFPLVGR